MTRKLTFDEAKVLVEREVIGVGKSLLTIDGLSKFSDDYYDVREITVGNSDMIIRVAKPNETRIYITSYKFINAIGGMTIERLLESLGLSYGKTIEIDEPTNVVEDVFGKEEAKIGQYELDEGMKFFLKNDASVKYCNKILTVKYDDDGLLKLVANRGRPKKIHN